MVNIIELDRGKFFHASGLCLLLLLLITTVSCGERDESLPFVSLDSPQGTVFAVAEDEIQVKGSASDPEGLSLLVISLSSCTGQSAGSATFPLAGGSSDFDHTFKLGDRYSQTCDYNLKVTAYDINGNSNSAFAVIHLTELPLKMLQVMMAGRDGQGSYTLFVRDSTGALQTGPGLGKDIGALVMDNREQSLLTLGDSSGRIRSLDPWNFSPFFEIYEGSGTQVRVFSGLSIFHNYYVGGGLPPFLRIWQPSGTFVSSYTDIIHPVTAVWAGEEGVVTAERSLTGDVKRLARYSGLNQVILASRNTGLEVSFLTEADEDHVWAGGNENGTGKLLWVAKADLREVQQVDLGEELLGLVSDGNRVWLLGPSGLRSYDSGSEQLSGVLFPGNFHCLAYDRSKDQIWLGGQDQVGILSSEGSLLASLSGGMGRVEFISFHYNK